jgi:methionyl-tRNA synthetase
VDEVSEEGGDAPYPVITGDYGAAKVAARWEHTPVTPGTPLAAPVPLFTKLDPSVADEELARLEQG